MLADKYTADLMIDFYRNLIEKNMSKVGALRDAMLKTKKVAPDPRYWAAFTLVGAIL